MRSVGERGLLGTAVAVLLAAVMGGAPVLAQVPDNRGLELDPDDVLSPEYGDSLLERERQRLEDARESGGSYVPMAHGDVERPPVAETEEAGEPAFPEAVRPELTQDAAPEPAYEAYEGPAAESLAVPEMLDALIEAWNAPPAIVRVRYPPPEVAAGGAGAAEPANPVERSRGNAAAAVPELAAVRAGDGMYARAVYAIDSDYPGPVFLEVLEPPLAGARLSGAFTQVRERLVLQVNALEYRGVRAEIDGWAVGLDCACYGVGGAVDRHWFERVLLPAAVNFVQDFLSSAERPEESVRIDGAGTVYERRRSTGREDVLAGAAAAVGAAGAVLLEGAPSRPTVRIARDAEMIVVFAHGAAVARGAALESSGE